MKNCANCNSQIQDDAKFCAKCGDRISVSVNNEKSRIIVPDQSSVINSNLSCPKCGSQNIHIGRKGYGGGRALLGVALLGPAGLLFGQFNANKIKKICLNCNKKF